MKCGYESLFPGKDVLFSSIEKRPALRQLVISSIGLLFVDGHLIHLPHKGLGLHLIPLAQLVSLVLQLLIHEINGVAFLLHLLPLLAVPLLHIL